MKFNQKFWTIFRKLRQKITPKSKLKFYKTTVVPALISGTEAWILKKKDERNIEASEIKLLRSVKGCSRMDRFRNGDVDVGNRNLPGSMGGRFEQNGREPVNPN